MRMEGVVGATLVAGLLLFMVGAGAWRLAYEQPLVESLRVVHADRRRRAWIHVWMIAGVVVTSAGVVGFGFLPASRPGGAIAAMAAVVYALGATCWLTSLAFRLTVVPWAAERTVQRGTPPDGFEALNLWAGVLYVIHMAAAFAAFGVMGAAVLVSTDLPAWLGWLGIGWGLGFLAGFVLTRFAGPFNPPFWAHAYTAVVGVVLLLS